MGKIAFCVVAAAALCVTILFSGGCLDQPAAKAGAPAEESSAKATPAGGKSVGSVLRDLGSAPASGDVVAFVQPYRLIGPAVVVAGILAFFVGGAATGWSMIALGAAVTFLGASIMQYPWLALLLVAGLGVWMVGLVRKNKTTENKAAKIIEAVNAAPHKAEVTGYIKAEGPKVEAFVDSLVRPIETLLTKRAKKTTSTETARSKAQPGPV